MKALTKAQLIEQQKELIQDAYCRGLRNGASAKEEEIRNQFYNAKLEQLKAAAKLMEEAGRIMSRAGYMVGKINQDQSR